MGNGVEYKRQRAPDVDLPPSVIGIAFAFLIRAARCNRVPDAAVPLLAKTLDDIVD